MKWIAVHINLFTHPKLRKLAKLLEIEPYMAVGLLVALWSWGLENNARKDGLIIEADKDDIGFCVSAKALNVGINQSELVNAFIKSGWIDEIEGNFYLHDWDTWQDSPYKYMERKENDRNRKKALYKAKEEAINSSQEDYHSEETPAEPTAVVEKEKYAAPFEEFWKAYPRKIEKGYAYKKYQARRKDGFSDQQLLEAAKNYAQQCKKRRTEKEYIKHPKTFLSDACPFIDYLPKDEEPDKQQNGEWKNPFASYKS